MAERPSFKKQRTELTTSYVDASYEPSEVVLDAPKFRAECQAALNELWGHMLAILEAAGVDTELPPANPHETTIHHTQFLTHFDAAKDEGMKMMIAWAKKVKRV